MIVMRDANHISVVVKGTKLEALRAGASRGIPLTFVRSTAHGEAVCITDMEYRKDVMKWYASGGASHMPAGTPLFFSETYVPPYKVKD